MSSEKPPGSRGSSPAQSVDIAPVTAFKPTRDFVLAFCSMLMVVLAVAFEATTLAVALPLMSSDLGGTALQAFWSGTGFLLASAVFQPTIAGLSAVFGRSNLIYVTSLLFAIGSLIAALANNFPVIVAGRVIQGAGGGGIIALTEVIVTDLVPLADRGRWFAILSAVWSVGTVAGPLIGAGFAQNVSWRWIFWINLPIIAIGAAMVFFFLKQAKLPGHMVEKLKRFDWTGAVLFTVGSGSFLFGISSGGVMYEWDSWQVLLSILMGVAVLGGFALWEARFATGLGVELLVPAKLFDNWSIISSYIQAVLHGAILWSLIYFLILYYQAILFYSPITSAVATLPETLTVAPSGMVVGIVTAITGRYRWALWSGWVITTLGAGLLYLLDAQTSVAQWIFLNIPVGIGTGMLFPGLALSIQASCAPLLNAEAAAFFSFARTFGQSIGVAVSGVLFQNVFKTKLEDLPAFADKALELSRDATIVVGVIKGMDPSQMKDDLIGAYNDSLKVVWIMLTALAGVSMLLGFTVKSFSLQREHVTKQGLVTNEKVSDVEADAGNGAKA
ncbi:Major facilitator superfamily transporter [Scedosporium apiospermum]|uniref:Major facilitator superfamily transporter n=1 Tax=Pseudallescheria apiosperma TaxID=563466 RepID=A0A084G516_PSEDA|nr:Major facilitator superfamily transporter [Scedosporium apiospermum]KEZ42428.1 Major facilitator superfamily transporter [Scedosporium apiospermum]